MDKYTLSDASIEDQKAFAEGLKELTDKLSLSVVNIVNKKAVSIKLENGETENVFVDYPALIIQKKTLKEGIVSPLSEEMTSNESSKKA